MKDFVDGLVDNDERGPFSKTPAQFKTKVQNHTLFMDKIRILFLTKIAEKQYPLGRTYLYSPYKGVPPSVGRGRGEAE